MKLLMITPQPPYPPNSGGRIRQWEQIRYLGRRHDLTVVSFVFTEEEYEQRGMLEGMCARSIIIMHPNEVNPSDIALRERLPWPLQWYATAEMQRTLEGLQSTAFDVVLFENLFMAHYQELFPVPSVLQEYNIESEIYRQYAALRRAHAQETDGQRDRAFWRATWMLMVAYENNTWPRFPLRTTVSQKDKEEIDRRCQRGRTIVIENGVNTERVKLISDERSRTILFMGTLDYFPNTDAAFHLAKTIMPAIWRHDPSITLCIAGRNPPDSLLTLAADPRIEVIADPEDMGDVARRCALSVVPLRVGGGTRLKILDSMSMGLPVVSTSLGCEGLAVRDGDELLVRDGTEEFAAAVMEILSDPGLRSRLRLNARRLVESRYDWRRMFERLETEIVSLVEHSKATL